MVASLTAISFLEMSVSEFLKPLLVLVLLFEQINHFSSYWMDLLGLYDCFVQSSLFIVMRLKFKGNFLISKSLRIKFPRKHTYDQCIWLVGCFGLNGPLRQYFSLYRAVSQREGERKEKRQTREKNVQTTPTRTYCKYNRPLPYCNPNQQDVPALEIYPAPSHHPTTPMISGKRFMQSDQPLHDY